MKKKILVVDDEMQLKIFIESVLTTDGYETVGADNGREAVDKYKKIKPDLVILDLIMPVMDGFEAFDAIRSINPQAKIIILTGLNEKSKLEKLLAKGACAFLTKPFHSKELFECIENCLKD